MRQINCLRVCAHAMFSAVVLLLPVVNLHAQEIQWARQFGTNRFDQANALTALDGYVYVVGDVIGPLPGQASLSANERDAFVRRYDAAGNVSWTSQFGSTTAAEDVATSVAANTSGVYVAGWTSGTLPQQNKTGGYNAFLRKYETNGNDKWTRQFGSFSSVQAFGVAVDATGVYVVGFVDCCGSPLPGTTTGTNGADAFVRKYDLNGGILWTRQFGTPEIDKALAVVVSDTLVYVAGTTAGTLATNGPTSRGVDAFVRTYGIQSGNPVWTAQLGTPGTDELSALALGPSVVPVEGPSKGTLLDPPVIYIGGRTTSSFTGQRANGLWDAYVMQLDSKGTLQWVRQFGGVDGDAVLGLAVGLTHLLVAGASDGALPGQTFGGAQDAFLRIYDFLGNDVRTFEFGNGSNDFATGVAVDARWYYVAGSKNGVALGLTPVGDNDAFVMKVSQPPLVPVAGPRPVPEPVPGQRPRPVPVPRGRGQ